MKEEISYLLTTPYTLAKSRTGGVLSRLLSRLDLELIGAQILAFSEEATKAYAENLMKTTVTRAPRSAELLRDYVLEHFIPDANGRRHRTALFLFKGADACRKLTDIAGALHPENRSLESITGETIRDTYADLLFDKDGDGKENMNRVNYFEPAVLTPPNQEVAQMNMALFSALAAESPNIIENMAYPNPDEIQRTLVIIKPDNWRFPSSRPGAIIDMFSRTGLRMIGCKIYRMSVNEAMEFYGGVEDVLVKKLAPVFGGKASELLAKKFGMELDEDVRQGINDTFGTAYARNQFHQIVEFMSGRKPQDCPLDERDDPGRVKSMVVIYEGKDAVQKIRDVLGPTDPTKAPGGTVRREFGSDVMVNTAHASDSPDNALREMRIVRINENNLASLMREYLEQSSGK